MACYLNITSDPTGASVYIDGKKIGTTKISNYLIQPGTYNIELKKTGYVYTHYLNYKILTTDLVKNLNVLGKKPAEETGSIKFKSSPSNAKVYLDTSYKGKTTLTIDALVAGKYYWVLKKDGYEDASGSVTVKAGETVTIDKTLKLIPLPEKTWLEKFLDALLQSNLITLNLFSPLSNTIKNEILFKLLSAAGGEAKLESWAEYLGNKFADEYPEYKILKGAPKGSLSVLAIIGIVGAIMGFGTLVNWLRKELPEPSGMAVWAAIEAKDWETAEKANEQYRLFIEKSNGWYASVLGWLNPFIAAFMNKNKQSQLTGYETYKAIIDTNLKKFVLPETFETYVRDIIDGDTVDTSLDIVGSMEKLPEYQKTTHARIRIVGIDAPEMSGKKGDVHDDKGNLINIGGKWADAAKEALYILDDKKVKLYIDPTGAMDDFGRILAKVEYEGKDVALEQIKNGLACFYFREDFPKHKYVNEKLYKDETLKAKNNQIGMWKEVAMVDFKILITSEPSNAKLFLDGIALKHNTPSDEVELKDVIDLFTVGKHKIRAERAGVAKEQDITIKAGDNGTIHLILETIGLPGPAPAPGEKPVTTAGLLFTFTSEPSNGKVYVNEVAAHHNTPTDEIECKDVINIFKEGSNKIRVTKGGYAAEKTITLKKGVRTTVHLELGGMITTPVTPPVTPPSDQAALINQLNATIKSLNVTIATLNARIAELTGAPPVTPPVTPQIIPSEISILQSWTPGQVGKDDKASAAGTSIQADVNNDGSYIRFSFYQRASTTKKPGKLIGATNEGWEVYYYNSKIYVFTGAKSAGFYVYYLYKPGL